MRLVEAEGMLTSGDWQGAMGKINALRTAAGVEPAVAASAAEAWTALKFERGVVLWLEGRRLGDFFRWNANNTPGDTASARAAFGKPGGGLAPGAAGPVLPHLARRGGHQHQHQRSNGVSGV